MISKWFIIRRIGLVGAFFVGFTPVFGAVIAQLLLVSFLPSMIRGIQYGGYGYNNYLPFFSVVGVFGIGIVLAAGSGLLTMLLAFVYNVIASRFPFKVRIDIDD